MTYEEMLDKYLRKLGRDTTAGEVVYDLRHLDAVPVVRCKDCDHASWRDIDGGVWKCKMAMGDEYHEDDFYCAWGERSEDETD